MVRVAVAVGLCALALAGCAGDEPDPEPAAVGLAPHELNWVRRFAEWGDDFAQALGDARAAQDLALAGGDRGFALRALRPVRECARMLDRRLPEAPTERLRAEARTLDRTCGAYARFARAQSESLRGDPGLALARADQAGTQAGELLRSVYAGIGGLLRDNRVLPRRRGGRESRVDPRYSRLATDLAYEAVEVRCWAAHEWPDVMRERDAFSNGYLNVHETLGFAWPEDARAHLAPEVCESLDRFSLEGRGVATKELATAVVVLAHEIGHLRAQAAAEAEVECRAVQEARGLARRLGADAAEADALVRLYWRDVYPSNDALYHSTQCHPGGYLDLDPADPRWP